MHSPEATLYCANSLCQAPNPESHRFCQQCRAALPKRYLWAVGASGEAFPAGELLAGRYFCKQARIFLDTQPGQLPESPLEMSDAIATYLRLSPYKLNLPQVYAVVGLPDPDGSMVLLLENTPIRIREFGEEEVRGEAEWLMPPLNRVWKQSSALRQLHWLWQIAHLWEPLRQEGVANSLLNPVVVRVEGALVRLLELQSDGVPPPALAVLGKLWEVWLPDAHSAIAPFLEQLCQQLASGELTHIEQVIWLFDQAIAQCCSTQTRRLQLTTITDQGPTRQRNEDACYPPSGTAQTVNLSESAGSKKGVNGLPLVVVCDGIGGHEGGSIASNLAIATIQQQLQPLLAQSKPLQSDTLFTDLEKSVLAANEAIKRRNDAEQRQDRQRMGTTLVMALGCAHELYLAHVGDSRAYRITRTGCYQVTMDDDLAAREVRMGYALYRDALMQPGSGSLVQALGMNSSSFLRPAVQRFLLDEDCLFLLCSDGLSDNDRVEEYWQTVLLPVLAGKQDLVSASRQLVAIANQQNGHDNVTVGLIHCRIVNPQAAPTALPAQLALLPDSAQPEQSVPPPSPPDPVVSTLKTQNMTPGKGHGRSLSHPSRSGIFTLLLGLLTVLGLGGLAAFFLLPDFLAQPVQSPSPEASPQPSDPTPPSPLPTSSPVPAPDNLPIRSRVLVNRASVDGTGATPVRLLPSPALAIAPTDAHNVPVGSILEIIGQQVLAGQKWLQFKVCSLPQSTVPAVPPHSPSPTVRPGEMGWVPASAIAPAISTNFSLTASQIGQCTSGGKGEVGSRK